jgi:hypothetical protein
MKPQAYEHNKCSRTNNLYSTLYLKLHVHLFILLFLCLIVSITRLLDEISIS